MLARSVTHTPPRLHWLDGTEGRILIRQGGLVVGRNPSCDLVLPDAQVSRQHCLFRLDEGGVEVVLLGRVPLVVNGAAASAVTALREGDTVTVCGHSFRLVSTEAPPQQPTAIEWALTRSGSVHHRVKRGSFTVGGGVGDDLVVAAWPPAALTFSTAQTSLVLQANIAGFVCGTTLEEGEVVTVMPGARVSFLGESLQVLALAADASAVTAPMLSPELPRTATLHFLPRGGRLTLGFGGRDLSVWLADRRCDLVAALLKPPAPYVGGEAVPDEVLLPRIWPGMASGRTELNTLVFRTRRDLVKADLDGGTLIERSPGAIRFRLTDGAAVHVGHA